MPTPAEPDRGPEDERARDTDRRRAQDGTAKPVTRPNAADAGAVVHREEDPPENPASGAPAPEPEPGTITAARDMKRLRRKGQDPTLDRGVDAKEMWRIFRIISEFVEAIDGMRDIRPAISIWGSARTLPDHPHYRLAMDTASELASMGYTIITGGGPGIMEAGNRGAKRGGGKSVGLGIRLPHEQRMNDHIDVGIEFEYFFIRKMMFTKYAAGLVAAPGGFGTMDEMFDTLTLIQTRKIRRIPVVLLGVDYYRPLVDWMRGTVLAHGNISPEDLDLWLLTDSPREAAQYLDRHIVEQTWWSQSMP